MTAEDPDGPATAPLGAQDEPGAAAQDARRKDDHVRLASAQHAEPQAHDFDHVRPLNHPLAAGNRSEVSCAPPAGCWTGPCRSSSTA